MKVTEETLKMLLKQMSEMSARISTLESEIEMMRITR